MQIARYFCPILNIFELSRQFLTKVPNIEFHENTSSGRRADTCGQTEMAELIGAVRDYVNFPINQRILKR
jgi:hypothetical protein